MCPGHTGSRIKKSNLIHDLLQPEKNSGTADMGLVPQPADNAHEFRVAADMPLHEMIQPERGQKAHADDRIQLNGD